jgi:hypothetical protein
MRQLTEQQYEELRSYEDGKPRWRYRPPATSLTRKGYLRIVPGSGHDRASSMFTITPDGTQALAEFRTKHGIPVGL